MRNGRFLRNTYDAGIKVTDKDPAFGHRDRARRVPRGVELPDQTTAAANGLIVQAIQAIVARLHVAPHQL